VVTLLSRLSEDIYSLSKYKVGIVN